MNVLPCESALRDPSALGVDYAGRYFLLKNRLLSEEYTQTAAEFHGANCHGPGHIARVLKNLDEILGERPLEHLGIYELWLTLMAVIYHDVGLLLQRDGHPEKSAEMLIAERNTYLFDTWDAKCIAAAIVTHGSKADIAKVCRPFPAPFKIAGHNVRMPVVCALVRLADELDEDKRRADPELMRKRQIAEKYPESEFYWRFCQCIPGINIEAPGRQGREITVNIHFEERDRTRIYPVNGKRAPFLSEFYSKLLKLDRERAICCQFLPDPLKFAPLRLHLLHDTDDTIVRHVSPGMSLEKLVEQFPKHFKPPLNEPPPVPPPPAAPPPTPVPPTPGPGSALLVAATTDGTESPERTQQVIARLLERVSRDDLRDQARLRDRSGADGQIALRAHLERVRIDTERLTEFFGGVPLADVFVPPTLVRRSPDNPTPISFAEHCRSVANSSARWVICGGPGSGKTTFLRALAGHLAADGGKVPVLVSLPEWLRPDTDGSATLTGRIARCMPPGEADGLEDMLERLGAEGRLCVLLDGLDEVPHESLDDVSYRITRLLDKWRPSSFVVSTRPVVRHVLSGFEVADLAPLERAQRVTLLATWLRREPGGVARDAEAEIAALECQPGLSELANAPMYLTLIALLIRQGQQPERQLSGLYRQILDLLLDGRHRHHGQPLPNQRAARGALWVVAAELTRQGRVSLPLSKLDAALYAAEAQSVREMLRARWREPREFLEDAARTTGILGPYGGPGSDWRFFHRSFQEMLTAEWLHNRLDGGGANRPVRVTEELLVEVRGIDEPDHWAEPYALLAGLIDDPDDLVVALTRANRTLGLRAMATAYGLRDATFQTSLELTATWQERRRIYERLVDIVGDAKRGVQLLDQLRARTSDGNDLFFIDRAFADAARRFPDCGSLVASLRARLFADLRSPEYVLAGGGGVAPLVWLDVPASVWTPKSSELGPRVSFVAGYRISRAPVTTAQYRVFDPKHDAAGPSKPADTPVVQVSWFAAEMFCRWLGRRPAAHGARLPLEAEWEHAMDRVAAFRIEPVREWCQDTRDPRSAPVSDERSHDPRTWHPADDVGDAPRICRGACPYDRPKDPRTLRGAAAPSLQSEMFGFRVLCGGPA